MGDDIQSVCVYCGSSSKVDEVHKKSAVDLGKALAGQGWSVVYGGGRVGLMGLAADAVLEAGANVIGIIPSHIQEREIEHTELTELHVVDSMHTRKQMMVDKSDAFVILAGGLGTLDEFFELLTWKQLGLHDKAIVVCNIDGYWDKLLGTIDHLAEKGFMRPEDKAFRIVERVEDVIEALKKAPKQTIDPKTKWI